MPRRQFIRDLQEASEPGRYSRLKCITPGDDDGTISCTFVSSGPCQTSVDIQLLVPDISDYPDNHTCMLYTTSTDDVPPVITAALEDLSGRLSGMPISEMLIQLIDTLERSLGNGSILGFDSDDMELEESSEAEEDEDMEDVLGYSDEEEDEWFPQSPSNHKSSKSHATRLASRLAQDLTKAKLAGFRVGYLGNKSAPIVCISCRVGRLGISDEAMEAWKVDGSQYLVVLIRYIGRYRPLEEILQEDEINGKASVEVHADLCDSYKPNLTDAIYAFNPHTKGTETDEIEPVNDDSSHSPKSRKITQLFISKPLNTLLRGRFVKILRYRYTYGFSWDGAERYFNDIQGKPTGHSEPIHDRYFTEETAGSPSTLLPLLTSADHLVESNSVDKSFPLIAMQFVLRHFVRCTEFCLVCHCKTNDAFEALKPYVCSNRLCLFQYMSLGFGPSLEWEIISQPDVVDLLISFTYSSARGGRLSDFPTGLGFLVPLAVLDQSMYQSPQVNSTGKKRTFGTYKRFEATLDPKSMELVFPNTFAQCPVAIGDWIVVSDPMGVSSDFHCRVRETSLWPTIQLSDPIRRASELNLVQQLSKESYNNREAPGPRTVTFVVYDTNFDDLDQDEKRAMIATLLETLPTVEEMRTFLTDRSSSPSPVLSSWRDRIPKSALDILRWIVASNRSCIIQENPNSANDSVYGMDGYMQFRFAQGAPDKEQRFMQSVAAATAQKNLKHPTIFAWHGSPLSNWHGILREGLHFRDTLHGRAFGHGVYMSSHFTTSSIYMAGPGASANGGNFVWPQSKLRITSAISLNEVVNMPGEFVSSSPHYVVAQLDWIQTRYLFVKCTGENTVQHSDKRPKPAVYYEQDPQYTARGPKNEPIMIPLTAFSQQRRSTIQSKMHSEADMNVSASERPTVQPVTGPVKTDSDANSSRLNSKKKRLKAIFEKMYSRATGTEQKEENESQCDQQGLQHNSDGMLPLDPWASDDTDEEDLEILFVPEEQDPKGKQPVDPPLQPTLSQPDSPKTDYIPSTLDETTLPLLGPPSYATPSASKALQRELKATLHVQETHPLHELGWYVDPNLISTMYQWIVELHSFDPELPIARDLQDAGLKSVVLEIRFWKDYPISPPFVRVIRPRFLGFQQGGGGHVTAGGALCMELLTNSGWSAASSIESVLLQVRMAISSLDPRPARLEPGQDARKGTVRDYSVGEAVAAYLRACRMHGWEVPSDFEQSSREGWASAN
ncbi:hypothetical protein VTO42DRAFT_2093 [Malbranchea cinnamomea]